MITLKQLIECVKFDTSAVDIVVWNEERYDNDDIFGFCGDELNEYMLEHTKQYWNYKVNYLDTYVSDGMDCLKIEIEKRR